MSEQLNQFNEDVDKWIKEKDEEGSVLKDNIVNLFKRAAVMSPAILKSYPGYTDSDTIMLVPDGSGSFKWVEAGSATPAETITITNAVLSNNNTITITAASANTTKAIEYSLNGTSGWQSSNVFTNVANGTYANITARLVGSTITDKWDSSIVVNYTPNVNPTVTLSLGATSVVAGNPVTLTATPSDSDGTISKVEFYVSGSKVGEATSSPWTYSYTPSTSGVKPIYARAIDNANGTGNSTTQNLTVNPSFSQTVSNGQTVDGLTLAAGAGTQLKYNDLPDGALPGTMKIYLGSGTTTQIAQATIKTSHIGSPFAVVHNGVTYYKNLAGQDLTITTANVNI